MANGARTAARRERKHVAWLHGEIKTPPFTGEGRKEAGDLLRLLQEGETLAMPQAENLSRSWGRGVGRFEFATVGTTGGSCSESMPTPFSSSKSTRRRRARFRK